MQFVPLLRTDNNQTALLKSRTLSGNIFTITWYLKALALHKITCFWEKVKSLNPSLNFVYFSFFLIKTNCSAFVFKGCNHSCRYKQASPQNWLGMTLFPMSHLYNCAAHRCRGGEGEIMMWSSLGWIKWASYISWMINNHLPAICSVGLLMFKRCFTPVPHKYDNYINVLDIH